MPKTGFAFSPGGVLPYISYIGKGGTKQMWKKKIEKELKLLKTNYMPIQLYVVCNVTSVA